LVSSRQRVRQRSLSVEILVGDSFFKDFQVWVTGAHLHLATAAATQAVGSDLRLLQAVPKETR